MMIIDAHWGTLHVVYRRKCCLLQLYGVIRDLQGCSAIQVLDIDADLVMLYGMLMGVAINELVHQGDHVVQDTKLTVQRSLD